MVLPLQLLIFLIPVAIYITLRRLRHREAWGRILEKLGWVGCRYVHVFWGLGVLAIIAALTIVVISLSSSDDVQRLSASAPNPGSWTPGVTTFLFIWLQEAFARALGEEVFFRGFLGGALVRKFGFQLGNAIQTLAFLLPHLLILVAAPGLWFVLIVVVVGGWLNGWLLHTSGSVLPGWLVHSLGNAICVSWLVS